MFLRLIRKTIMMVNLKILIFNSPSPVAKPSPKISTPPSKASLTLRAEKLSDVLKAQAFPPHGLALVCALY